MAEDEERSSRNYIAFISYSRHDTKIARVLQSKLERYVLPAALRQKPPARDIGKRPLKPVFRDEDELIPGGDLPSRIRASLAASRFLIVVCSPASATSIWVERELAEFIAQGKRDAILAIVVDGEPDAAKRDLDPALECLCPSLLALDPLWVDWRQGKVGEQAGFLRLVAALLTLGSYDELVRRDAHAKRRRTATIAVTALAFTALAGGTAYFTREAQSNRARAFTAAAQAELAKGDYDQAEAFAVLALADSGNLLTRSNYSEAQNLAVQASVHDDVTRTIDVSGNHGVIASPDGMFAAVEGDDGAVTIIETMTGRTLTTLAASRGHAVALSPDDRAIVLRTAEGLDLRDVRGGDSLGAIAGALPPPYGTAFSADARRMIFALPKGGLGVFDLTGGRVLASLGTDLGLASAASLSSDGTYLAAAFPDHGILLWNVASSTLVHSFSGHTATVNDIAIDRQAGLLLSAASDHTARVWDMAGGALRATWRHDGEDVANIAVSPDGKYILTRAVPIAMDGPPAANQRGAVRLFDATTLTLRTKLPEEAQEVRMASFTATGHRIVTAGNSYRFSADEGPPRNVVAIWDPIEGTQPPGPIFSWKPTYTFNATGGQYVRDARALPDGHHLLVRTQDGILRVVDADRSLARDNRDGTEIPFVTYLRSDGDRIVTATSSWVASIGNFFPRWRIAATKLDLIDAQDIPGGFVVDARIGGSDTAVFTSGHQFAAVTMDAHKVVWTTHAECPSFTRARIAADNTVLVVDCGDSVLILDPRDGRLLDTHFVSQPLTALALSANAARLAMSTQYGEVVSVDTRTWQRPQSVQVGDKPIQALALIGNGDTFVAAAGNLADLRNAHDGHSIAKLSGHDDVIRTIAVSPDGQQIVTASTDGTARIWLAGNGALRAVYHFSKLPLTNAIFSQNGRHVIMASMSGLISIATAPPTGRDEEIARTICTANPSLMLSPDSRAQPGIAELLRDKDLRPCGHFGFAAVP